MSQLFPGVMSPVLSMKFILRPGLQRWAISQIIFLQLANIPAVALVKNHLVNADGVTESYSVFTEIFMRLLYLYKCSRAIDSHLWQSGRKCSVHHLDFRQAALFMSYSLMLFIFFLESFPDWLFVLTHFS